MKRSVTIILAAALTAISGWSLAQQVAGVQTLRGADTAAADQAPDAQKAYTGKKPGLQKPIARTFKEQPPLVPHAVDNFDEITVEENQCMSCHSLEKFKEKNAPKSGVSQLGSTQKAVSALIRATKSSWPISRTSKWGPAPAFTGTPAGPHRGETS